MHVGKSFAQKLGDLSGARCGAGKAKSRNPAAHAAEKSDTSVVPEAIEQRAWPCGDSGGKGRSQGKHRQPPAPRTLSRISCASVGLEGVREAA